MRRIMRDAHAELLKGLTRVLGPECGDLPMLTISGVSTEPWASATFSGERHVVEVRLRGGREDVAAARDRIAAVLPGIEFDVPGHLVASVALADATLADDGLGCVCEMRLEALTVED